MFVTAGEHPYTFEDGLSNTGPGQLSSGILLGEVSGHENHKPEAANAKTKPGSMADPPSGRAEERWIGENVW
jgi:hypothetical protein